MHKIALAIVGLSPQRAELFCSALSSVAPNRLTFHTSHRPLTGIGYDELVDRQAIVFADRLSADHSFLRTIQELRTIEFYWEAIHLCADLDKSYLPGDWSINAHAPLPDLRKLTASIFKARGLGHAQRQEIIRNACTFLIDDLYSLRRALEHKPRTEPSRVRKCVSDVLSELERAMDAASHESLKSLMSGMSKLGSLTRREMVDAASTVAAAEAELRGTGEHEALASALHTLNNTLRLATHEVGDPMKIASRILTNTEKLRSRAIVELDLRQQAQARAIFDELASSLVSLSGGGPAFVEVREHLALCVDKLRTLTDSLTKAQATMLQRAPVQRIIIIEDDPDWRREIKAIIESMSGLVEIELQEAASLSEAQSLLRDMRPALALVDLGLPVSVGAQLQLDAGLGLIKSFTGSDKKGRRYQHRFIVLTAAENFADAVRHAVAYGISPASYLQKGSAQWESDLRSQVRLELRAASPPPRIEVFQRTGRIARVEGLEVKLDYPQWCFLVVLAESHRGVWCEPQKIANILYWNYALNPEARSKEAEKLDPEERILLQLPYYSSELRKRLSETYVRATHRPPAEELLSYDEEIGYRLNANARVLHRVEEHFRQSRAPTVLVVEDSPEWGEEMVVELKTRGFVPHLARSIEEAHGYLATERPDLISLDMELPATGDDWKHGRAGAEHTVAFLDSLRASHGDIPVAILTAIPWRDDVMLEMLRRGVRVDDYLSKHSSYPARRLAASLSRLWQEALTDSRILDWDANAPLHPIKIDPRRGLLVEVAGYPVESSGMGREVLKVLSETPNTFVSRLELLDAIYGGAEEGDEGPEDEDKALNQHLKRVRAAITAATEGRIPGDEVICGDRGVYWLRGLVQ